MDGFDSIADLQPAGLMGSVVETSGTLATVADLPAPIGAVVRIGASRRGEPGVEGEVVGFRGPLTMVSPLQGLRGIRHGAPVRLERSKRRLAVGDELLGRVVNAMGQTIDGGHRPALPFRVDLESQAPPALKRPPIDEPLSTGVRAIDSMLPCGRGQRLGVFAGSGVGKSTLMGMVTRQTNADVIVTGLVGERGREVNEFLQRDLGPEGRARSVVVVATSDEPATTRLRAASTATAIAEYFRDTGRDVLLMIDSLTRTALASRELGLAAGEPPTTRGYPPSTFGLLPKLVERAGRAERGSITALYTVLVEGDDPNDPIADALRGLLDGHLWLSRKLAARGHFPSIDITESISRLATQIAAKDHQQSAQMIQRLIAALKENEDLISIGAYRRGSNVEVDAALEMRGEIDKLLRQGIDEAVSAEVAIKELKRVARRAADTIARPRAGNAPPTLGANQPGAPS